MDTYGKIKNLCEQKRTTITALEAALGFSRGSIGKLKTGSKPSIERMQKIADYFGIDPAYFFDDSQEPKLAKKKEIIELVHEAELATPDDLKATLLYLKRLNAYARLLKERGMDESS